MIDREKFNISALTSNLSSPVYSDLETCILLQAKIFINYSLTVNKIPFRKIFLNAIRLNNICQGYKNEDEHLFIS